MSPNFTLGYCWDTRAIVHCKSLVSVHFTSLAMYVSDQSLVFLLCQDWRSLIHAITCNCVGLLKLWNPLLIAGNYTSKFNVWGVWQQFLWYWYAASFSGNSNLVFWKVKLFQKCCFEGIIVGFLVFTMTLTCYSNSIGSFPFLFAFEPYTGYYYLFQVRFCFKAFRIDFVTQPGEQRDAITETAITKFLDDVKTGNAKVKKLRVVAQSRANVYTDERCLLAQLLASFLNFWHVRGWNTV